MYSTPAFSRPFLKWAGGKKQLICQYQPYFPKDFECYYEPFLGGGAVFFALQPRLAFLSDINGELINTYQVVQNNVEDLIALLREHQARHNQDYYYQIRARSEGSDLERAARFIYLNKTCFNGLYRENSQGKFNVPVGRYKNPKICDVEGLNLASFCLNQYQVKFAQNSFEWVLEPAQGRADFVYFDPPYFPLNPTSNFTAYSRYVFNQEQQIKLWDVFVKLTERGVRVMVSNSDCPLIRELYQGFKFIPILAARSINAKAEKRGKITELLIVNYDD